GGAVAAAQCFDLSGRLAMAPVAAWLRQPVLAAATRSLEPVWRREVYRLVPDQAHHDTGPAGVGSGGERAMVDAWQRQRFFEGLAQAVLRVEQPLLLVLDDVQWCDQQTLSWLSSLQALAPRRRLMVVLTLREPDAAADEDVPGWVSRQRAAGILAEVAVAALSIEETGTLAASLAGRKLDPVQVAVLHATTGGFPLFVVEAVRSRSADPTPPAAVLRRRLDQLSPDAREVAALASALPRDVTLDLLSEASDLDAVRVTSAVDELWRARILREVGAGYAFSHDLLRAAAYDRVSPPRRWLLHRRLAQALELAGGTYGDDVAGLLADQYDRGGRPDRALNHYTEAATIAAGRFALPEAVRLLREALRVTGLLPAGRYRDLRELEVLLAMGAPLTAWQGYASAELQRVLERAVDLARETAPASTQMQGLMALWASRFVQGRVGESHRLIRDALTIAVTDDVLLGEAHFAYAGSTVTLGHPAEAIEHFDIAHERCAGAESLVVGTRPDVHALAWSAHAHWLVAQPDTAATRASEAVRRARELGHPYSLAVAIAYGAVTQQLLGERTALRRAVRELAEVCERYGFAYYREWGLVLDGWLRGGPEGLALARRGVANLRAQKALVRMPYWLSLLAELQCDSGQAEAAAATLDAARSSAQTLGDAWWLPEVLRQRAALAGPHQRESLLAAAVATAEDHGSLALAARVRRTLAGRTTTAYPTAGTGRTPGGTPGPAATNAARTARS
ncbi:MAG TPA: AAA family ATPase, partial [Nocardioidaceae bacterium]|nr:AAA family ATPase [Nocardioidaceae bacterium]